MRHFIVRAVVLVALLTGTTLAYAFSTGPPASRTGAFAVAGKAAEPACNVCHSPNPLNSGGGALSILDVPPSYQPGQQYTLRLRLDHTWVPMPATALRWGFQIQAVQATTGDSAGAWVYGVDPAPNTFRLRAGSGSYARRRYLEHTSADIQQGAATPVEWTLKWTAPPGDSGKIYFFAAGNAANGDGASVGSGDWIYTDVESTTSGGAVDVPVHPAPLALVTALEAPYPNPMWHCADLTFTLARGGLVNISVFDAAGRRVRTVLNEYRAAGTHGTFWDGRNDAGRYERNGVYFVRMQAPGEAKPITRKITLAR
uniref:FlgD/Vpr Ig-like domain-containing protein n=1 Tax=Eiseniibacteriota bacterium TaxID=2212470 RepID=A0A832I8K6_UNCEI